MLLFKYPEVKHATVSRKEGQFNLLSSEEKARYTFHFPELSDTELKEKELKTYFTLELEEDFNYEDYTSLECAHEIQYIINNYFFHSEKENIDRLVEYLESIEEHQEKLRKEYDIEYAKAKIEFWKNEVIRLTEGKS